MELSTSVVKKFVDLTKQDTESAGSYFYGTGIVNGDNKYVQLDGSDSVTSVSLASDLETGDRVLVYIEGHQASVIGNITYPSSGRGVIDVSNRLQDFEELVVGDFYAVSAEIEDIHSNYVSTQYLETNYLTSEYILSEYTATEELVATYATIENLAALKLYVDSIEASEITVDYLDAHYADIESLAALQVTVGILEANYANIETLLANYAKISDLEVTNENVSNLTADYANLKYVLAGYEVVEDLQSIHLTVDNVVIDNAIITDAMIVDLSADKITAGTIYTARVRIQTDENDESLYMDNSLIQMSDENQVRLQAGKDATGLYNFYIWNENGDIMFDALGATADGIGTEVIVNTHVANDANIAGYKLDIDSVVSCINENGNLEVDAGHVTINGNTLDFEIDTIIQDIDKLQFETGITNVEMYFALSESETRPPVDEDDFYPAYVNVARVNHSYVNVFSYDELWTEIQPTVGEGEYLWVKFKFYYSDGTTKWSNAFLLSDGYLRKVTTTLQTELEVVQGQITAKIWETDIEETVTTAITDLWSEIEISIGDITLSVGQLSSSIDNLDALVSEVEIELGQITLTVSDISESAIVKVIPYFGVSNSNTEPPVDPVNAFPAYANVARVNFSYVNVYDVNDIWTTEKPTTYDGQYLWARFLYVYIDGSTEWSDPFLYTDEYFLSEKAIVEDRVSSIEVALDDITLSVSKFSSDLDSMSSAISQIELTVNNISIITSSNGGGMASIILNNGNESSSVDVVTDAREAFEAESSSIIISAGTITFNSGTLIVNSGNFTLDSNGNVTAKNLIADSSTITNSTAENLVADSSTITNSTATNLTVTGNSSFYGDIHATTITLENSNSYFTFNEENDDAYGTLFLKIYAINTNVSPNSNYEASSICLGSGGIYMTSGSITTTDVKPGNYSRACSGMDIEDGYVGIRSDGDIDFYVVDSFDLYGKGGSGNLFLDNYAGTGETFLKLTSFSGYGVGVGIGSGGSNRGVYDNTAGSWMIYSDSSNHVHVYSESLTYSGTTYGYRVGNIVWISIYGMSASDALSMLGGIGVSPRRSCSFPLLFLNGNTGYMYVGYARYASSSWAIMVAPSYAGSPASGSNYSGNFYGVITFTLS